MVLDALAKFWLLGMLAMLAACEFAASRRAPTEGRVLRWPTNLTIGSLNALLITVPIAPVALAAAYAARGWGLLSQAPVPFPLAVGIAVVVLDGLGFALQRLMVQLAHLLTARGLGVTRLTLTLTHERFRDEVQRKEHAQGWAGCLHRLARKLGA